MLQAALGALILLGIYKFMNAKSDYDVTWWLAFVFILAPGFLIFLLSAGLHLAELPADFALLGYSLYFLIPFLILRYGLEYQPGPALKFSAVVPLVAIATEIPFVLLMSGGPAW